MDSNRDLSSSARRAEAQRPAELQGPVCSGALGRPVRRRTRPQASASLATRPSYIPRAHACARMGGDGGGRAAGGAHLWNCRRRRFWVAFHVCFRRFGGEAFGRPGPRRQSSGILSCLSPLPAASTRRMGGATEEVDRVHASAENEPCQVDRPFVTCSAHQLRGALQRAEQGGRKNGPEVRGVGRFSPKIWPDASSQSSDSDSIGVISCSLGKPPW